MMHDRPPKIFVLNKMEYFYLYHIGETGQQYF